MNKQRKEALTAEHERLAMIRAHEKSWARLRKEFMEKKAAKALAERNAILAAKRAKGLAHYQSKLSKSKQRGT